MITPYENLANAIVMQAVKDYRGAAKSLKRHPNSNARSVLNECERFFLSGWFEALTGANGEFILKKLQQEDKR
jgi:hypothetical protein